MQINNNVQSQNFGMALRIKPEAVEALKNAPAKTLETIERIGRELKDTKDVDLEIGENLAPRIVTPFANKYKAPFTMKEPTDEFVTVKTIWDGTEIYNLKKGESYNAIYNLGTKDAALAAYKKINTAGSEIERAAEVTKLISERNILDADKIAATKAQREQNIAKAMDLMEKYGA